MHRLLTRALAPKKKVFCLDCDNTLWGGAVGELGAAGVVMSAPFLRVQQRFVELQRRGALLCLVTRNEEADVRAVLRERSSRIMHTNQRLPAAHWLLLWALSILTVLGVALGQVSAHIESGVLVAALAFVVPLAFVLVLDMNDAFDGVWRASAAPMCGVQQHLAVGGGGRACGAAAASAPAPCGTRRRRSL